MQFVLEKMSARLTVLFFVLICFEIGALLIYLPWHRSWTENHLLIIAADRLHWGWLVSFVLSDYLRGAITGLGIVNLMIGTRELVNFKKTVRTFQSQWQSDPHENIGIPSSGVLDNGPAKDSDIR